jgi:hypothetical protein
VDHFISGAGEESRKKLRVLDDRTSQLLAISFNKLHDFSGGHRSAPVG